MRWYVGKENILGCTPSVQEQILGYHGSLEDSLGSEDFGTSFYGYDSFINDDKEGTVMGYPNDDEYQGLPDSPEIYCIIYNSDEERSAKYNDQYIGAGVLLSHRKGDKLMAEVRKCIKYDDISAGKVNYNAMHNKSVYEVSILMEQRSNLQLT